MKGFTLIGDTHGNFEYIRNTIKTRLIMDTTLLHVGDFGVGFTTERDDKIQLERDIFSLIWDFERKYGVEISTVSITTKPVNVPDFKYKYYYINIIFNNFYKYQNFYDAIQ